MPQDELWAASARTIGFVFRYELTPDPNTNFDLLTFSPMWSKRPTGRVGDISIPVEAINRYALPDIFEAAYNTWWKCKPKDVPSVVRAITRTIPQEFALGERP